MHVVWGPLRCQTLGLIVIGWGKQGVGYIVRCVWVVSSGGRVYCPMSNENH
jgi:hypothetical protein